MGLVWTWEMLWSLASEKYVVKVFTFSKWTRFYLFDFSLLKFEDRTQFVLLLSSDIAQAAHNNSAHVQPYLHASYILATNIYNMVSLFYNAEASWNFDCYQLPHMLPSEDAFAAAVSALGIENKDGVVVYDGKGIFSAARVWWWVVSLITRVVY